MCYKTITEKNPCYLLLPNQTMIKLLKKVSNSIEKRKKPFCWNFIHIRQRSPTNQTKNIIVLWCEMVLVEVGTRGREPRSSSSSRGDEDELKEERKSRRRPRPTAIKNIQQKNPPQSKDDNNFVFFFDASLEQADWNGRKEWNSFCFPEVLQQYYFEHERLKIFGVNFFQLLWIRILYILQKTNLL